MKSIWLKKYVEEEHYLFFKQYMAAQGVDKLTKGNDFEIKLGGEKRDVAVMFVDIRGFTPMSENLEPEHVVQILNEYL